MIQKNTPPYEGEFSDIDKVKLKGTVHKPTFYWCSIYGREDPVKTEWLRNLDLVKPTKKRIINFLLEQDLDHSVYAVLTFPHVTSVLTRTTLDGNRHTNGGVFLYNTIDMSPNTGIVAAENGIHTCGLEKYVDMIENHLWFNCSRSAEEYYSHDRVKEIMLLESIGYKIPNMIALDKL